jgi:hypothetical protein
VLNLNVERFCSEVVEDIFEKVKTPIPPRPDFTVPENRAVEYSLINPRFEEVNKMQGLWYSETAHNIFLRLVSDVKERLGLEHQSVVWDFKVTTLKEWIGLVDVTSERKKLQFRLEELVHISRKRPTNRSPLFPVFKVCGSLRLEIADELRAEGSGAEREGFGGVGLREEEIQEWLDTYNGQMTKSKSLWYRTRRSWRKN